MRHCVPLDEIIENLLIFIWYGKITNLALSQDQGHPGRSGFMFRPRVTLDDLAGSFIKNCTWVIKSDLKKLPSVKNQAHWMNGLWIYLRRSYFNVLRR